LWVQLTVEWKVENSEAMKVDMKVAYWADYSGARRVARMVY
jgi:hypothetical protein